MKPVAAVNFQALLSEIELSMSSDIGWCSLEKASTLAAILVAMRPKVVVELGVWMGGSAIPMAITLRHLNAGQLVAIDAWSTKASVAGQEDAKHVEWWGNNMGDVGHEKAYQTFILRLKKYGVAAERCKVVRQTTGEAEVPPIIDLLHHDANHGPEIIADIKRWTPSIRMGGLLVIDDLDWAGNHVVQARDLATKLGFVELYSLGTGCVMQRVGW